MSNAIEAALNRASPEQKERAQQAIAEARRNISLVSMQQMEDITPSAADSVARNAQIIEEAKRTIPYETMKDVDSVSPPLPTPSPYAREVNSNIIQLHPQAEAKIESIQQGEGNNYLNQNAVDRALSRPSQELEQQQQLKQLGR